jgi:hypothetical protein
VRRTLESRLTHTERNHCACKKMDVSYSMRHAKVKRNRVLARQNEGEIPNFRVVHVAPGKGYTIVEGNCRASRNGRVSDLPPEIPKVTIRTIARDWI